jgi:hypothetical protein
MTIQTEPTQQIQVIADGEHQADQELQASQIARLKSTIAGIVARVAKERATGVQSASATPTKHAA